MDLLISTPGDRYSEAHKHFSSSGMDIQKIILILVGISIISFLVYIALKDNDKDDK